ncbi:MAG: hypothetical protein IPO32_20515 [Crocinitomicaceae bacterium]|nr:hypothetical protein [Crocinitomicaceae bacterium]
MISGFGKLTGVPIVLNTSYNILRRTNHFILEDYKGFLEGKLDILAIRRCLPSINNPSYINRYDH